MRLPVELLVVLLFACLNTDSVNGLPDSGPHPVLFIGNSLVYTNDLPGTLSGVATQGGDTLSVGYVALPNVALIDHALGQSGALAAIRRGNWEFVLLQQGPTW